jgi:hypothetical protein
VDHIRVVGERVGTVIAGWGDLSGADPAKQRAAAAVAGALHQVSDRAERLAGDGIYPKLFPSPEELDGAFAADLPALARTGHGPRSVSRYARLGWLTLSGGLLPEPGGRVMVDPSLRVVNAYASGSQVCATFAADGALVRVRSAPIASLRAATAQSVDVHSLTHLNLEDFRRASLAFANAAAGCHRISRGESNAFPPDQQWRHYRKHRAEFAEVPANQTAYAQAAAAFLLRPGNRVKVDVDAARPEVFVWNPGTREFAVFSDRRFHTYHRLGFDEARWGEPRGIELPDDVVTRLLQGSRPPAD